jgi:hypothetical protein
VPAPGENPIVSRTAWSIASPTTWQFTSVSGGTAPSCPPGYDTAALFNVAVDANGNHIAPCTGPASVSDTCFVDLFRCSDFAGVSAPLPPTRYQTWVSITDSTGVNTYAQSLSAFLDVRAIDLDFHATIATDGGYFAVDWDLKGASSQAPLSCAQAGSTDVEAVVTISGGTTMVDAGNNWPCEDHYGVTKAIAAGSYTVAINALDADGSIGTAPEYTNKAIQGPNKVTDLGTAIIPIDGL